MRHCIQTEMWLLMICLTFHPKCAVANKEDACLPYSHTKHHLGQPLVKSFLRQNVVAFIDVLSLCVCVYLL